MNSEPTPKKHTTHKGVSFLLSAIFSIRQKQQPFVERWNVTLTCQL